MDWERNKLNHRLVMLVSTIWVVIIFCGSVSTLNPTPKPTPTPVSLVPVPTAPVPTAPVPTAPVPTAPVPTALAPGLDAFLAQILNALPEGRMVFNPPLEMRQGEKERVEVRILPLSDTIDETKAQATLVAGLQGSGTPQVQTMRVGTIMKARLSGDGFEISPLNEEEQMVSSDTFTQWAWDITAVKAGEQELNLLVTVRVTAEGLGERGRDLPVITKGVKVSVDPTYSVKIFIGEYWQWLATTLAIPIVVWLYKVYSDRKAGKERDRTGKETARMVGKGKGKREKKKR